MSVYRYIGSRGYIGVIGYFLALMSVLNKCHKLEECNEISDGFSFFVACIIVVIRTS